MIHRAPPSFCRRLRVIAWLVAVTGAVAHPAYALDRQTEAAAKEALKRAASDHVAGDDDGGLLRAQRAIRACGASRCSPLTHASLLRDAGAMQFGRGEKQKASASFGAALDIADDLPWNPVFDGAETMAEWAAVKDERAAVHEVRPEGDLDHIPASEQAVNTPLPMYVESTGSGIASVVVKYKVPGATEFKKRTLRRFGGGWGGTIPCQDVRRGLFRYFVQAFDKDGVPLGNSGDVKHLYFVPIRWAILGDPPHLPGQAAPETCTGREGAPDEGTVETPDQEPASGPPGFVRLWIGVAGSIDLTIMPSGTNVCALSPTGVTTSGFYCTNPDGSDYPSRSGTAGAGNSAAQPVLGKSGDSSGGLVAGDIRVLVTADYAITANFLTGVRVGYVANSYPGAAASKDGRALSIPVHAEVRETYLFGHDPLAHAGFAPYGFVAAGYAQFDAGQLAPTLVQGVPGARPTIIWSMSGPFFAAAGGGARYAFSPRIALSMGLRAGLAFGAGGFAPSFAPEVALQYGF